MTLGSENRNSGKLWGRSWGDSGGPEAGQGGSERVTGDRLRPKIFFHFLRFKIMKLCRNLNLLLKRLEIDEHEFFEELFSESGFKQVFLGSTCTKILEIFS